MKIFLLKYPLRFLCATASCIICFIGCAPSIQYSINSTASESSTPFTQITTDKDSVDGCTIYWKSESWLYDARNRFSVAKDGSAIAFMNGRNNCPGITVLMLDGSSRSYFKPNQCGTIDPSISPDSKHLAYAGKDNGSWNIYETELSGTQAVRRMTNEHGINLAPCYFPDPAKILFTHIDLLPGNKIPLLKAYITGVDAANGMVTRYTEGFSPCFIPHTDKVIIVRYNETAKTTELWSHDLANDSEKVVFSQTGRGALDPSVSPDGKTIAFVSLTELKGTPANLDIYTISMDGSQCTQKTFFEGNDICPRWDASGKALYFLSQRATQTGSWNIWKMDISSADNSLKDSASKPVIVPSANNTPLQKNIPALDSLHKNEAEHSLNDTVAVKKTLPSENDIQKKPAPAAEELQHTGDTQAADSAENLKEVPHSESKQDVKPSPEPLKTEGNTTVDTATTNAKNIPEW
jgi:Tol biopolymer transport system component